MRRTSITSDPLSEGVDDREPRADAGAEIVFLGRVRDLEKDRPIVGLDYEHYPGMAESELEALAIETIATFDVLDLVCVHRVGLVRVGEPSIRVAIRSRHRTEGIRALDWFIKTLKERVPIWKWGVTADGARFPSGGLSSGAGGSEPPEG